MRFCGRCGTKAAQTCPKCKQALSLDYRFCGYCGAALALPIESAGSAGPPARVIPSLPEQGATAESNSLGGLPAEPAAPALTGERRQATVLVADVKGSTQILEQVGSEAWVEAMNRVLQIMTAAIYRYGGVVDQFRGDGLVAFFGAWQAHEDDPERALLAALNLQQALNQQAGELLKGSNIQLLVRVGVHTGEVITTNIGIDAQHLEDTAMGAAVTLAARLEAAAEPGTILVSEHTYRLVEAQFKWQALGQIPIRGLAQPVAVYRANGPVLAVEQDERLQPLGLWSPMVGREPEFDTLLEAIADLRQGKGGILLVSGEAGMGKSRLIFEARQQVERQEALRKEPGPHLAWLQGRCRSYSRTLPDSMWVELWQRWLGFGHGRSKEEALEQLRGAARQFWGEGFEAYYSYLAAFLALPLEEVYSRQVSVLDAEGLRRRFFIAARAWLEMMSRLNPLVIVFTEVHWADETSLELLKYCLPLVLHEKILFVVVYRPEAAAPMGSVQQHLQAEYPHRLNCLELKPLTGAQSSDLIQQMVGSEALSLHARTQIIEKSNGNPYFLTELIRSLIERGALKRDSPAGRWRSAEDEFPLEIPDTLKSLLAARIDSLPSGARRLLQLASVIGSVFWFQVLERLEPQLGDLRARLAVLQQHQLVSERGLSADLGREFSFNSNLLREAVYDSLLIAQREEVHRQVAAILEQYLLGEKRKPYHGLIAYHYRQAGDCQNDLYHTLLAAQEAQNIYAHAEAAQAYLYALEAAACLPPGQSRSEWQLHTLRRFGQLEFGIGKVDDAERHFREAITIAGQISLPPQELARLYYWLGEVLFWKNSFEEPVHLGEQGLSLLGGHNESIEAALMNQLVAIGCSQLDDHDKFIDYTLRTAGFIQRLPYSEELRPAFDHIIALYGYTLKNTAEARRWLAIFQQKAQEAQDRRALGESYGHAGGLAFQEGNVSEAIGWHRRAVEQFTQIGDSKHVSRAWKSMGVCLLQEGKIVQAARCFARALEAAEVFGNEADYATGYWHRGQVLLCQGAWDEALACFQKASSIVQKVPFLKMEWALSGIGRLYLARGKRAEAQSIYRAAMQYAPTSLFRNPYQANELLSGLEQSFENKADFRQYAANFRQEHPEIQRAVFKNWYLEPVDQVPMDQTLRHHEVFLEPLTLDWEWEDPLGGCSYELRKGLVIQAANERNLYFTNRSAPRLLRKTPIRGDFTIQAACRLASKSKPAIGGLLVWLSGKYWFCLEKGSRGAFDLTLRGFLNNNDVIFGRGELKASPTYLRLERRGQWLAATCSGDGQNWWSAGGCELSTGEDLYVGLHAVGHINRLVYPGTYRNGTAIRFDEFWLWGS